MNCGHKAGSHLAVIVQCFCHRRQAVGGAGRTGNDSILRRQGFVIDPVDNGLHIISRRSGNQHLPCAGIQMCLSFCLRCVEAGALQYQIDVQFLPRKVRSIRLLINRDFFSVHNQAVLRAVHLMSQIRPLYTIVFEQVRQHRRRCQIVNRYNFKVLQFHSFTESQSADSAKSINC